MSQLITLGTKTSTGGEVITASSDMTICGVKVVKLGDIATCTCGSKSCRGQGPIYKAGTRKIEVNGSELAKEGDPVDTGCGSCVLLAPNHNVNIGGSSDGIINIGGNGGGISIGGSGVINIMGAGLNTQNTAARTTQTAKTTVGITSASSAPGTMPGASFPAGGYNASRAARSAYELTEKEWNQDLQRDLKTYLESNHVQVCILSTQDAARCVLNLWAQKSAEGESFGGELLSVLDEIKFFIDNGFKLASTVKVSLALGGLGITTKQFKDAKGVERIIVSSLWNDSKLHYAIVNGLNIKKNHPYLISNPTIKQLGILAEDVSQGFKKGAISTIIVSASINTNELVFNDDYHLVDWFGEMGSDIFKALAVWGVSEIALALLSEAAIPIVVGFLIYVIVDRFIDLLWNGFQVEDKIVGALEEKINVR